MADLFALDDFVWDTTPGNLEVVSAWHLSGVPQDSGRKALYLFQAYRDGTSAENPDEPKAPRRCYLWLLREHPRLFVEFGQMDPTPEACCAFAREYGFLYQAGSQPWAPWCQRADGTAEGRAEALREWVLPILRLRAAIDLWLAYRQDDYDEIRERLTWTRPEHLEAQEGLYRQTPDALQWQERVYLRHDPLDVRRLGVSFGGFDFESEMAGREHRLEFPSALSWRELRAAGVEDGDSRAAAYALLLAQTRRLLEEAGPYLPALHPDRRGQCQVSIRPVNLVGAIAMQFALAVVGNKEYRQCRLERCRRWFEVGRFVQGPNREFCSDSCRAKDYQERRAMARQLYGQGMPLAAIAGRLNTDVDKVKFWIAATRQRRTRRQVEEASIERAHQAAQQG